MSHFVDPQNSPAFKPSPSPRNLYDHPRYIPGAPILGYSDYGCVSHHPGHSIHFIQMRRALNHMAEGSQWLAEVLNVAGNTIVLKVEGAIINGWNHDARELSAIADAITLDPVAIVWWSAKYRILTVSTHGVGFALYLHVSGESDRAPEPCRFLEHCDEVPEPVWSD